MTGLLCASERADPRAALLAAGMSRGASVLASSADDLIPEEIRQYAGDPLGYVLDVFPWGQGELREHPGPDEWQIQILTDIRDGLLTPNEAILEAVSSGHGIGKSALVGMLVCWAMDTAVDTRGVVTANTDTQLATKTWPEISKWFRLGGLSARFELTATRIYSRHPAHRDTWRLDRIPWSETRPEAFAGLHNQGKRILVIFDEASAIPEIIHQTTEGALTDVDTEILWVMFGNPTRNTGRFREVVVGRLRHRWKHYQVDSRTCRVANKAQIAKWLEDYDEDSDFIRVRVRGLFPRASDLQFIPSDWVAAARKAEELYGLDDPLIMTLDVARGGSAANVIGWRRGMSAKIRPWLKVPGSESHDSMRVVSVVAEAADQANPDAIMVDATGVGGPVANRLRQLGYPVFEVQFGAKAADRHYANKRAEMWAKGKEWLKLGGAIPDSNEMETDLTGPEFHHNKADQLVLESKEDMQKRGLASPDEGDALMLSFAFPVAKRQLPREGQQHTIAHGTDFDPYGSN